jgi:Type III flagellar switch regulator (C-ring) FliN C-term
MQAVAIRWSPIGSFHIQAATTALCKGLSIWSTTWFFDTMFQAVDLEALSPRQVTDIDSADWRMQPSGIALRWVPTAANHLIDRALQLDVATIALGDTDHKLIDSLKVKVVEDMKRQLDLACAAKMTIDPAPGSVKMYFDPCGGVRGWIKDKANIPLCEIALPYRLILSLMKSPKAMAQNSGDLTSRHNAWGPDQLQLEAQLGCVTVTYSELMQLSVGDVLVLRSKIDQPIALTMTGAAHAVVEGYLCQSDGQIALQINGPLSTSLSQSIAA